MHGHRGQSKTLLPASRQRTCELLLSILQAQAFKRLIHEFTTLGHLVKTRHEFQILADRQVRPERKVLRHIAGGALDVS